MQRRKTASPERRTWVFPRLRSGVSALSNGNLFDWTQTSRAIAFRGREVYPSTGGVAHKFLPHPSPNPFCWGAPHSRHSVDRSKDGRRLWVVQRHVSQQVKVPGAHGGKRVCTKAQLAVGEQANGDAKGVR